MSDQGYAGVEQFAVPEQTAEQTEEEYFTEVAQAAVEYLGLDPETIKAAGFTPGTREYLNYIIEQADKIIAQLFGANIDELFAGQSVADLQAMFRRLTEKETAQLLQALYVRGALGQMTFSREVTDPFTGLPENVTSDEAISSALAGQQRGYARSLEHLARLYGPSAAEYFRGLLGRNVDLFGLEKAGAARRKKALEEERLEDEDEYEVDEYGNRRRRRRRQSAE